MAIPFLACMALVASLDHLPPRVLPSIAVVEGGRVGLASPNQDGSYDLGPMQVNTRWLPVIANAAHANINSVETRLLNDPCFNISAAGAILHAYLNQDRGNLMQAIGDYHSHTARRCTNVTSYKVLSAAEGLFRYAHPTTTLGPSALVFSEFRRIRSSNAAKILLT